MRELSNGDGEAEVDALRAFGREHIEQPIDVFVHEPQSADGVVVVGIGRLNAVML